MDSSPGNDVEWEYNPRKSVANVEQYTDRATELSVQARERYPADYDIRYGAGQQATLDVFHASQTNAPMHVFLHGGYWRGRDKRDYSYIANTLTPSGVTTVIMNYDLCPDVTLPEIVAQVREGIRWIYAHASELEQGSKKNTSKARYPLVSFSGHSAGAHLLAAAFAADSGEHIVPAGQKAELVLISGIYELEPVLSISVNEEIRLKPEQVAPMSPMRHPPASNIFTHVVVGGSETRSWIEQSRSYANLCLEKSQSCTYWEIPNHDHFSIMTLLEKPDNILTKLILSTAMAYTRKVV